MSRFFYKKDGQFQVFWPLREGEGGGKALANKEEVPAQNQVALTMRRRGPDRGMPRNLGAGRAPLVKHQFLNCPRGHLNQNKGDALAPEMFRNERKKHRWPCPGKETWKKNGQGRLRRATAAKAAKHASVVE